MCRFNLILTKDEKAVRILEKNGYQKMFENLNDYAAYQKGYCNCGSCAGGLIEKKDKPFEIAIEETKREQLMRLNQIKEFMYQPGYEDRKELYNRTMEGLFQRLVYHEQEGDTDVNPEYKASLEMLQRYQLDNALMHETTCYFKTEEEEESAKKNTGIPLSQLIEIREEMNESAIEIPMESESLVIDAVITRTEKNNYKNYRDEFEEYAILFCELLKEVPDFIFATIWCQPENMKLIKTISVDSFQIEDLVYLNYNEMIRIQV